MLNSCFLQGKRKRSLVQTSAKDARSKSRWKNKNCNESALHKCTLLEIKGSFPLNRFLSSSCNLEARSCKNKKEIRVGPETAENVTDGASTPHADRRIEFQKRLTTAHLANMSPISWISAQLSNGTCVQERQTFPLC